MICKQCFYHPDCSLKPSSEDRCNVFLKDKKVHVADEISVSPMDTIEIGYEDLKDLLKDLDSEK